MAPNPIEIKQAGETELRIRWNDGHESLYPVAYLRRACSCAACIDEWTGEQILQPGQVSDDVKPVRVSPVGRYAINVEWSDGHRSGIYSFDYLRWICPCSACRSESREARPEMKKEPT